MEEFEGEQLQHVGGVHPLASEELQVLTRPAAVRLHERLADGVEHLRLGDDKLGLGVRRLLWYVLDYVSDVIPELGLPYPPRGHQLVHDEAQHHDKGQEEGEEDVEEVAEGLW